MDSNPQWLEQLWCTTLFNTDTLCTKTVSVRLLNKHFQCFSFQCSTHFCILQVEVWILQFQIFSCIYFLMLSFKHHVSWCCGFCECISCIIDQWFLSCVISCSVGCFDDFPRLCFLCCSTPHPCVFHLCLIQFNLLLVLFVFHVDFTVNLQFQNLHPFLGRDIICYNCFSASAFGLNVSP